MTCQPNRACDNDTISFKRRHGIEIVLLCVMNIISIIKERYKKKKRNSDRKSISCVLHLSKGQEKRRLKFGTIILGISKIKTMQKMEKVDRKLGSNLLSSF